jgi:hypothetical protein
MALIPALEVSGIYPEEAELTKRNPFAQIACIGSARFTDEILLQALTEVLSHFIDMRLQWKHSTHGIMFRDGSLLPRMDLRFAFAEDVIDYLAIGFGATTMIKLGLL